ncbi:glycosyltransferase [Acidisphaera sp. L21]|uniref:glycosyltransferase n=1 Tax=Acidisphaera sp. L21 TaxID=1641851 RepID=UPI0020B1785A|nr:glycosyltransferase [Acidisphaera sp. L21]
MIRVAVLIPCHNEEVAIGRVVHQFRSALPQAVVFVYDNNSTDRTVAEASAAGAVVRSEPLQGKGNVVRRMFADIEADAYILVDGDDTYDATAAPEMLRLLVDGPLDMVTAARISDTAGAYRTGHRTGNVVLTRLVTILFGDRVSDMLSGYRAFSRRFVKSFPALSTGFETETEFTVHALELAMPVGELTAYYKDRPAGSVSKLHTYTDGLRILRTILLLIKEARPFQFFFAGTAVLVLVALVLGIPVVADFMTTGLVPRLPTAMLATALMGLAFLSCTCGFILDSVARGRKEAKRMAYLAIPSIGSADIPWSRHAADAG